MADLTPEQYKAAALTLARYMVADLRDEPSLALARRVLGSNARAICDTARAESKARNEGRVG